MSQMVPGTPALGVMGADSIPVERGDRQTQPSQQYGRSSTMLVSVRSYKTRERAFRAALMPGCPPRGRRSQTSTRPTLLRSQPNTSHPRDRVRIGLDALTLSRASASGGPSSNGGGHAPLSSTGTRARRGRR
jgi:hypothetical protein